MFKITLQILGSISIFIVNLETIYVHNFLIASYATLRLTRISIEKYIMLNWQRRLNSFYETKDFIYSFGIKVKSLILTSALLRENNIWETALNFPQRKNSWNWKSSMQCLKLVNLMTDFTLSLVLLPVYNNLSWFYNFQKWTVSATC